MKAFLLRELAFLFTPVLALLNPGSILARLFWIGFGVVLSGKALAWAMTIFALQPAWYEIIGILILLFLSFVSFHFALSVSIHNHKQ